MKYLVLILLFFIWPTRDSLVCQNVNLDSIPFVADIDDGLGKYFFEFCNIKLNRIDSCIMCFKTGYFDDGRMIGRWQVWDTTNMLIGEIIHDSLNNPIIHYYYDNSKIERMVIFGDYNAVTVGKLGGKYCRYKILEEIDFIDSCILFRTSKTGGN